MREEEGKKIRFSGEKVRHGRATTVTGRAYASAILCFGGVWVRHGRATTGTGCAKLSGQWL